MKKDSTYPIPSQFFTLPDYPAFDAFSQALWSDEAAVMVGAGFSRFCERESGSPAPPLWSDFELQMKSALGYLKEDGPDALRLAQEYQTLHGDDGLTRLISKLVSDEQWEPGELHKQLLELPWRDILTTNWDTLLERTKPPTPDRVYGCIRTVQDIAHQTRPRIVKLHGSLPSHKPFIFTEDDFRTYPVRFAPFVNLAQQVMLENELCLIGFSGTDPNFLAWSGWVRDTLSVSARRIRLVGVLNLSPVSRSLLEARNVTPIDLAPLVSTLPSSEQHQKALEIFFAALLKAKPPSPFVWKTSSDIFHSSPNSPECEKATYADVADAWAADRDCYPGWIVAPRNETQELRLSFPTLSQADQSATDKFRFACERIWRHKTAGIWLNQQDLQCVDSHFDDTAGVLSIQMRIHLCVAAATEWRRYQKWEHWSRWMLRLEAIDTEEARLHSVFEKAQRALLDWDDEEVLRLSRSLKSEQPIWLMRRASLLATLFLHREAAELYEAALLSVRQKLLTAPKSAWLISLEGWAAIFYRVSFSALSDDLFAFPEDDSEETRLRYIGAKAEPWDIISRLENLASNRIDRNRRDSEPWELLFQPGRYKPGGTLRTGDDECPFYGLLDVIERTGAPEHIANFNVFSTRLENSYRAISSQDENDLLTFLARYRGTNKKALNWILPRMKVARLQPENVRMLCEMLPKRIERLLAIGDNRDGTEHIVFLLELLARIVIRLESKQALQTFDWVANLLHSPGIWWGCYSACGSVLAAAVETMEPRERQKALRSALHLKTPGEANAQKIERNWPELFESFYKSDFQTFEATSQDTARISALIALVKDGTAVDRGRALRRLHALYVADKLDEKQKDSLEIAIWNRCGEVGWPSDTELHPWIFLELPGRRRAVEPFVANIVEAVSNGQFNYEVLINLRIGLKLLEDEIPKFTLVACVTSLLGWEPVPTEGRNQVSLALSGDEGLNRAVQREIGETLARSVLPRLQYEDFPKDVVGQLRNPKTFDRLPSLVATAYQIYRIWPDQLPHALQSVRAAIASRDSDRVFPAYIAIMQFINSSEFSEEVPSEITEILIHACEHRVQPGLSMALDLLADLVTSGKMSKLEMERVSMTLPNVLEEYRYDQKHLTVPSMAELTLVRKNAHRVSRLLIEIDPELQSVLDEMKRDPMPEVRTA